MLGQTYYACSNEICKTMTKIYLKPIPDDQEHESLNFKWLLVLFNISRQALFWVTLKKTLKTCNNKVPHYEKTASLVTISQFPY